MNWTCPRILHDLLASYDWPALSIRFPLFFSHVLPGHPLEHLSIGGSIGAPFFQRAPLPLRSVGASFSAGAPSHFIFFFHNSCARPPPFFSLLLTTMPHGSRSVTTSLDCVGAPAVAVLCESDCPSSACVVQSERKKKKRVVSVIVGNRKVPKKSANVGGSVSTLIVERLMDDVLSDVEATFLALQIHADTGPLCFKSTTPRDAKALAWLMDQGKCQAGIVAQASKAASLTLRSNDPPPMISLSNDQSPSKNNRSHSNAFS
jgi:hypothetical protein